MESLESDFDLMEQYEYFCTVSRHLYSELEKAIAMSYMLSHQGADNTEWRQRISDLHHKIDLHLQGFEIAVFEKEINNK